jgi:hypothetical protein
MNRRERDLRRTLSAVAIQNAARLTDVSQTRGNHLRAIITKGSTSVSLIAPLSSGDRRSLHHLEAFARRTLRGIAP